LDNLDNVQLESLDPGKPQYTLRNKVAANSFLGETPTKLA